MAIFTNFTEAQYNAKYEVNLTSLANGMQASKIVEACDMTLAYIEDNSPTFDRTDLETAQITLIQTACMMQLRFLLDECNYSSMSGFDAVKGTLGAVPHEISREVRKYLARRIIYRGF